MKHIYSVLYLVIYCCWYITINNNKKYAHLTLWNNATLSCIKYIDEEIIDEEDLILLLPNQVDQLVKGMGSRNKIKKKINELNVSNT